jgi:hypothetical protein
MLSGGAIARLCRLRGRQQRVQPRNCTRARASSAAVLPGCSGRCRGCLLRGCSRVLGSLRVPEAGAEHDDEQCTEQLFYIPQNGRRTVRTSSPSSDQLGQLPVTVLNSGGPLKSPARTSASTQAVYHRHGHGCVTKRRSLQTVGHVAAKVQPYGGGTTPGGHGKELVVVLGDRTLKNRLPDFQDRTSMR